MSLWVLENLGTFHMDVTLSHGRSVMWLYEFHNEFHGSSGIVYSGLFFVQENKGDLCTSTLSLLLSFPYIPEWFQRHSLGLSFQPSPLADIVVCLSCLICPFLALLRLGGITHWEGFIKRTLSLFFLPLSISVSWLLFSSPVATISPRILYF